MADRSVEVVDVCGKEGGIEREMGELGEADVRIAALRDCFVVDGKGCGINGDVIVEGDALPGSTIPRPAAFLDPEQAADGDRRR